MRSSGKAAGRLLLAPEVIGGGPVIVTSVARTRRLQVHAPVVPTRGLMPFATMQLIDDAAIRRRRNSPRR